MSWWTSWNDHLILRVVRSSATIDEAYRFLPARLPPNQSLPALPVEKYIMLSFLSTAGVHQTHAPPRRAEPLPGRHPAPPGACGPEMVKNPQPSLPVLASICCRNARKP